MPILLREKVARAEKRYADICEKYWSAHAVIKQKGQDIENVGMVNRHFRKCMQKSFPAMHTRWGNDEKERRLAELERTKDARRFLERMRRKQERLPPAKGSPKAKETPAQKKQRLEAQRSAKTEERRHRDEMASRFKNHDRERFQGLGALFDQQSAESGGSQSNPSRSRSSSPQEGKGTSLHVSGAPQSQGIEGAPGPRKEAQTTLGKLGARFKRAFRGCIGGGCSGSKTRP